MLTVLAPVALIAGGVAIAAVVVAHLLSVQQPRVLWLPTARFLWPTNALAVARAHRPRDVLLLVLRVFALSATSAAFAGVSCAVMRPPVAAVVVLDGTGIPEFWEQARAVVGADSALGALPVQRLVTADSAGGVVTVATERSLAQLLDSAATVPRGGGDVPGLSALLLAARRAATAVAQRADSVVLVVLSPLHVDAQSAALTAARSSWPGAIVVPRIPTPVSAEGILARSAGNATVVWPDSSGGVPGAVATVRAEGGNRVRTEERTRVRAVIAQGEAVIAPFIPVPSTAVERVSRDSARSFTTIAWWHDGSPAIVEHATNAGCERTVLFAPPEGDVLASDAARGIRGVLNAPCSMGSAVLWRPAAVDSAAAHAMRTVLRGEVTGDSTRGNRSGNWGDRAVPSARLRAERASASPLTPWLLAVAVALLVLEWFVRQRVPVQGDHS